MSKKSSPAAQERKGVLLYAVAGVPQESEIQSAMDLLPFLEFFTKIYKFLSKNIGSTLTDCLRVVKKLKTSPLNLDFWFPKFLQLFLRRG